MKRNKEKDEEEKYEFSKFMQAMFFITVVASMFIRSPFAIGVLFSFLGLATTFDVMMQEQRRRREK